MLLLPSPCSASPVRCLHRGAPPQPLQQLRRPMHSHKPLSTVMKATSEAASTSKTEPEAASTKDTAAGVDAKSSEYSETMSKRMGTSLTYRHEAGLDFNRILPDLIVGSCLQTPADVDRLAEQEGVTTIFCLQEDSDMAYFNLDIEPIKARCKERGDIKHVRFPIRDFDPFDLRRRLPKAVTRLAREHRPGNGTAYIHCTAGMGRAPGTALAYMNWVRGMQLDEAHQLLTSLRTCSPKVEAIRAATVDLLLNVKPVEAEIAVWRLGTATKFEIAGLDVGWHQRLELKPEGHRRVLRRALLPGRYQWKLIVDGQWGASMDHPTMQDGTNTNNFIHVAGATLDPEHQEVQSRLLSKNTDLTADEREELLAMLCPWDTHSAGGPREVRLPDVLASIGEDPRLP